MPEMCLLASCNSFGIQYQMADAHQFLLIPASTGRRPADGSLEEAHREDNIGYTRG